MTISLRNHLIMSGLGLALSAGAFGCDGADDGGTTMTPDRALRAAALDLTEAIAAAEAKVPGGLVVEAEFEPAPDDGTARSVYEVEILVDGAVQEVVVDASTGEVLNIQVDPEDLDKATGVAVILGQTTVTPAQAIEAGERAAQGRAFTFEVEDDAFEVGVLTDRGAVEVELDLNDASVIEIETDDAEMDDDDDDDADDGDSDDDDDDDDDDD